MRVDLKLSFALGMVILCWAYSPIGIKLSLSSYSATHLALARFIIASVFLLVLAVCRGIRPLQCKDIWKFTLLGVFAVSLHHLCLNLGQQWISASASSILAQSTPIFTTILSCWVYKEKISIKTCACIMLGLIGALLVCFEHASQTQAFHWQGLWVLMAALSWSIYFVLQKNFALDYDHFSATCYTIWFGSACLLIYLPGLSSELWQASWQANLALIILGIFPSALAYVFWAFVLRQVALVSASMFLYCVPLCAMLMAAVLLDETITAMIGFGALLILASLVMMQYSTKPI